ncbi:MFS transporter [Actinomadura algeriensis]|uniref:Major facilitator superfamily (MFS) profile domain-containing protein n=1 Tax=Actinomadura algeriensis TaxID=1679523 RepID=A0ABR9JMQ7_9ACTN|nr:hypothetical protein [Actinomadura algeriensis]MBE1531846.1 hypothetical protein [Actinomadura algeriensis]
MGAVPASETGAANSLNTLMRALGTSVASAVAGVILAEMTVPMGPAQVPTENAFKTVMAVGAGAALVAFLIASLNPGRRPAAAEPAAPQAPVREKVLVNASQVGLDGTTPAPPAGRVQGESAGDFVFGGIPVTGHVRGAENAPVTGAAVTLISLDGRQVGQTCRSPSRVCRPRPAE